MNNAPQVCIWRMCPLRSKGTNSHLLKSSSVSHINFGQDLSPYAKFYVILFLQTFGDVVVYKQGCRGTCCPIGQ